MKNRSFFSALVLPAFLLCCSFTTGFAQKNARHHRWVDPVLLQVSIKAYECANGKKSLLAYDSAQHSLSYYDCGNFQITWLRNGVIAGTSAFLECASPGQYHVIIIDEESGAVGEQYLTISRPKVSASVYSVPAVE